jgi:Domain of unknown function (DUF4386)
MKMDTLGRFGGYAAILLGVVAIIGDVIYLLLPADQRLGVKAAAILPSVARGAPLLLAQFWVLTLEGVLGIAVVLALSRLVQAASEGWVRFTSVLALVGFAVTAVSNVITIARLPAIAAAYVAGDAATKAALAPTWRSTLDPYGLWGYGAVGLWVLVVSVLALRSASLPRSLAYVGLAYGVLLLLIPVALLTGTASSLLIGVVVLATLAGPVWWIWTGLVVLGLRPLPSRAAA